MEDSDPHCVLEVPSLSNSLHIKELKKEMVDNILSSDAFIIRNFAREAEISPEPFKVDALFQLLKNDEIDVSLQEPAMSVITK